MAIESFSSTTSTTVRWKMGETHALSETVDEKNLTLSANKTFGTGSGNANIVWHDTVAAGTISLAALTRNVLAVAGAYAISTVKTVRLQNPGTSAVTVTFAACGISGMSLPAGGVLVLDSQSGWATASATLTTSGNLNVVLIGVGTGEV